MRDLVAGIIAVALFAVALSLATTLHYFRQRRLRARRLELEMGRRLIAEIPAGDDLVLFTEDETAFHYGSREIRKDAVVAVRVLINGAPIAAAVSPRRVRAAAQQPTSFEDRPEGIARDRWDVAIETDGDTSIVECGAIRERVSQELARAVFDAVRLAIERPPAA
jgi:hypothetical protein